MNYKDWSDEYYNQAYIIKKHISKLRKSLKNSTPAEVKDLNHRISILYPIYLDLIHTAKYISACQRREKNGK